MLPTTLRVAMTSHQWNYSEVRLAWISATFLSQIWLLLSVFAFHFTSFGGDFFLPTVICLHNTSRWFITSSPMPHTHTGHINIFRRNCYGTSTMIYRLLFPLLYATMVCFFPFVLILVQVQEDTHQWNLQNLYLKNNMCHTRFSSGCIQQGLAFRLFDVFRGLNEIYLFIYLFNTPKVWPNTNIKRTNRKCKN